MEPKKTSQSANSTTNPVTQEQSGQTLSKRSRDKTASRTRTSKAKGELPTPLASFEF